MLRARVETTVTASWHTLGCREPSDSYRLPPWHEEVSGSDRPAHALRRWSSADTARPINIRVAKTSCTRAVDGSGLIDIQMSGSRRVLTGYAGRMGGELQNTR